MMQILKQLDTTRMGESPEFFLFILEAINHFLTINRLLLLPPPTGGLLGGEGGGHRCINE